MVVPKSIPTTASRDIFMAVSEDVAKADPESVLKDSSKVEPRTTTISAPKAYPKAFPKA